MVPPELQRRVAERRTLNLVSGWLDRANVAIRDIANPALSDVACENAAKLAESVAIAQRLIRDRFAAMEAEREMKVLPVSDLRRVA